MGAANLYVDVNPTVNTASAIEQITKALNDITAKPYPVNIELRINNKQSQDLDRFKEKLEGLADNPVKVNLDNIFGKSFTDKLSTTLASIENISKSLSGLGDIQGLSNLTGEISQLTNALNNFKGISLSLGNKNPVAKMAAYGQSARETISQLRAQATAMEQVFQQIYSARDGMNSVAMASRGTDIKFDPFHIATALDSGASLQKQMDGLREYIGLMQRIASVRGIDLSPATSQFTKTADELISETTKIRDGSAELDESVGKLKNIFGGGINSDEFTKNLSEIGRLLGNISTVIGGTELDGENFKSITQYVKEATEAIKEMASAIGSLDDTSVTVDDKTASALNNGKYIKKGSERYNVASKRIESARHNVAEAAKWTAAEAGSTRDEYNKLGEYSSRIDALEKKLQSGKLAVGAFRKEITKLEDEISRSTNAMKEAGENKVFNDSILSPDSTIPKNAEKYKKAFDEIKSLQDEISKNAKAWDAASVPGSGSYQNYTTYTAQSDALERLKQDLIDGKLTAESYSSAVKAIKDAMSEAASAIKKAGDNVSQFDSSAKRIKELGRVAKQSGTELVKLGKDLSNWTAAKNGKSAEAYIGLKNAYDEINAIYKESMSPNADPAALRDRLLAAQGAIQGYRKEIIAAGEAHKSFGDRITDVATRLSSYMSIARVAMAVIRTMKQMVNSSMEIESAMTRIQIVTGATDQQMTRFFETAAAQAKEVGQSITDVASSLETFARLGYGLTDATELSKYATIMANVGDTTVENATTGITSIIKAYDLQASDAEHVSDVLIDVGQKYAISAEELMTAFERGGAALAASGTSFEQSAGLFAATNAALQNAATTGTIWKTVSARIRGAKSELEELGEYSDDLADGFSKYRDELKQLTGVDIMVDEHTYKDMLTIFTELAQGWDDLADTSRARVAEILGGTRNLSGIMSTIQNIADAQGAYTDAMNSAGVATEANNMYMDTANAHLQQLKASFQELSADAINSTLIKNVLDFGRTTIEVIDKLIDKLGPLQTLLLGIGAIKISRGLLGGVGGIAGLLKIFSGSGNVDFASGMFDQFPNLTLAVMETVDAFKAGASGATVFKTALSGLGSVIAAHPIISTAVLIAGAVAAYDALTVSLDEAVDKAEASREAYNKSAQELESTKTQLDSVRDRINEINSLDGITLSEQAELTRLEKEREELERQLAVKKEIADIDAQTAANDAREALGMKATHQLNDSILRHVKGSGFENELGSANGGLVKNARTAYSRNNWTGDLISYVENLLDVRENIEREIKQYELDGNVKKAEEANKDLQELNKEISDRFEELDMLNFKDSQGNVVKGMEEWAYRIDAVKDRFIGLSDTEHGIETDINKLGTFIKGLTSATEIGKKSAVEFVKAWHDGDKDILAVVKAAKNMGLIADDDEQSVAMLANSLAEYGYLADDAAVSTDGLSESLDSLGDKLKTFSEYQDTVKSALSSSRSASGLTADEIEGLTNAYSSLNKETEGFFDPSRLFENTLNGIHLNEQELERLNQAIEENTLADLYDALIEKQTQLSLLKEGEDTSALDEEIYKTKQLISQYEGMTSAFGAWQTAQSISNERDNYAAVGNGYEDMKKLVDLGWWGDDSLEAYLDLMLSAGQQVGTVEEQFAKLNQTIAGTSHSLMDYWQYNDDNELVNGGLIDFLDDVMKLQEAGGALEGGNYVWLEDGVYHFDLLGNKINEVAEAFGTTPEMIQLFERALSDADFEVQLYNFGMESVLDDLTKLQDAGTIRPDIDFSDVDMSSIDSIKEKIKEVENVKASINVDEQGAEQSIASLDRYIASINSQRITLEINAQLENGSSVEDLINMGDAELMETIHVNDDELETARLKLKELQDGSVETAVTVRIDETQFNELTPQDKNAKVIYGKDTSEPDSWIANNKYATVIYRPDTSLLPNSLPTITRYVNYQAIGSIPTGKGSSAYGTLSAARAAGSIALDRDETALVNELGTESIIRDGQWMLLSGGMHQADLKKGDIILSAAQTRALLLTGAAPGRGRSFAYGTLLSGAYGTGSGSVKKISGTKSAATKTSSKSKSRSSGSRSSSGRSSNPVSSTTSNSSPDLETIDWIEVAIARIERAIDHLGIVANSVFQTFASRMSASADEITKVNEEITLQQKARDRYIKQANSVGLSADLALLVREGTIDIRDYNKETADLIKKYSEWWDKAKGCTDAIKDLNEELGNLYKERFENTETEFNNQLSLLEHLTNTYNNEIDYIDELGYLATIKFYEAIRDVEQRNLEIRKKELNDLIARMSDAVNSGAIKEGSEAWYEMQIAINGAKEEIQATETEIVRLGNTIRETLWDRFEYVQDLISNITAESDFLIKLMSNSDLFTDNGQMTEQGLSTMGLHGQNYNVYMNQADRYAEKIKELNADIANDPNNTKLLEQREEWLKAQREAILNAEDEKQAIVDLVEQGIQKELAALKELIDTYNDSLDSAKDLYEYQKKVNDQAGEVAKLQKRLAAYQGDTSEESRATIQKLNTELKDAMEDLQETQQDRAISEQKKMLDQMYSEYEEVLNRRLDNVDLLISDMIDVINTNSGTIGNTIETEAKDVGYTISESIRDIWAGDGFARSVIAQYGDGFLSYSNSVTVVLSNIAANVAKMVESSDDIAIKTTSSATSSTAANKPATTSAQSATSSTKKAAQSQPSGNGIVTPNLATLADRLNVRNAPGMNGTIIRQVMNGNLLETDWKEQNGWLHVRIHNAKEDYWGWVSKQFIKAYAKGARHIGHSGLAWTQEEGTEAILRPSENAILTKLKSGDSVLKADATDNIFDFGNNPRDFLAKLGIESANDVKRLVNGNGLNAVDVGGISINIPIDHVSDYNDLVNQMRTDDRFEKLVQSMTVDRLVGASKLAKNKYKW